MSSRKPLIAFLRSFSSHLRLHMNNFLLKLLLKFLLLNIRKLFFSTFLELHWAVSYSLGIRITLSSHPGTTKLSSKHSWSRCLRSQEPRGLLWSLFSSTRSFKGSFPGRTMSKDLDRMFQTDSESLYVSLWPAQSAHKSHQQARSASTRERKDEPQI